MDTNDSPFKTRKIIYWTSSSLSCVTVKAVDGKGVSTDQIKSTKKVLKLWPMIQICVNFCVHACWCSWPSVENVNSCDKYLGISAIVTLLHMRDPSKWNTAAPNISVMGKIKAIYFRRNKINNKITKLWRQVQILK